MYKKILMPIVVLSVITTLLIIVGFNKETKILVNTDINERYLESFKVNNEELVKENDRKFGKDINKSSLNIQVFNLVEVENKTDITFYDAEIKGVIKSPTGNFNIKGTGDLQKLKLSNEKWIYNGDFEGEVINKIGTDTVTLSFLYDPETKETSIGLTSGLLGDIALLPFGQSFLSKQEIIELDEIIRK